MLFHLSFQKKGTCPLPPQPAPFDSSICMTPLTSSSGYWGNPALTRGLRGRRQGMKMLVHATPQQQSWSLPKVAPNWIQHNMACPLAWRATLQRGERREVTCPRQYWGMRHTSLLNATKLIRRKEESDPGSPESKTVIWQCRRVVHKATMFKKEEYIYIYLLEYTSQWWSLGNGNVERQFLF